MRPLYSITIQGRQHRRKAGLALILALVGGVVSASNGAPAGAVVPSYQVGEVARETITTPFPLTVTDRAAERNLERKIPPVFRFCSEPEEEAVKALRAALSEYRRRFQTNATAATRGQPLPPAALAHASFRQFVDWYRQWNPEFPLSDALARAWALGESDQAQQAELESKLRAAMRRRIRSDDAPMESGRLTVRLVPVKTRDEALDLPSVERRGLLVDRVALLTVAQAQNAVLTGSPAGQKALGKFLGHFIRPNCFLDAQLTAQLRAREKAAAPVLATYQPGDAIIRPGDVVNATASAALQALAAAYLNPPEATKGGADGSSAWGGLKRFLRERWWWLAAVLVVAGLTAGAWRLKPRRRGSRSRYIGRASPYTLIQDSGRNETIFLPLRPPGGNEGPSAPTGRGTPGGSAGDWSDEVRAAERRAEELMAQVREGLAPHLAREMMQSLVQELLAQRARMVEANQAAEQSLAALEARFDAIQQRWEQRLREYQARNVQLEQAPADRPPATPTQTIFPLADEEPGKAPPHAR